MLSFSSSSVYGLQRSTLELLFDDGSANLPYPPDHFDDGLVNPFGSPRSYDSDGPQHLDSPLSFSSSASSSPSSRSVSPFGLDDDHQEAEHSSLDDEFVGNTADLRIGRLDRQQPTLLEDDEVHESQPTPSDALPACSSVALNIASTNQLPADQVQADGQHGHEDNNIQRVHQTQAIHLTKGHKSVIQGDIVEYDVQFNAPMVGHLEVPADLIHPGRTYRAEVRVEPVDPQANGPSDQMHYIDFGFTLSDAFKRADSHLPLNQQQLASDQVNCRRPMLFDCLIQPGLTCIGIDVRMLLAVQNAGRRDNDRLPSMRMTISLYGNGNSHSLVHWSAIFHGGRRVDASASRSSSRSPKRDRDEDADDSAVRAHTTGGKGGKSAKKPRSK